MPSNLEGIINLVFQTLHQNISDHKVCFQVEVHKRSLQIFQSEAGQKPFRG
jgi:hypothetical protein